MSEFAFRFLLHDDGQPFLPSTCFVVADPKINHRYQWDVRLDEPQGAEWVYRIDDMKDWMLNGKPTRQIVFDRKNPQTPHRDLKRDDIFREYLHQIVEKIPAGYRERRKYALMPSIAEDETRTRYKEAVEAAIPGVTVVPEPEMVAEYFRLLGRNLELQAGRNNVILVVDVGAATANMTLIVSRRDRTLLDIDPTGAQRDLRLRALRGDSAGRAGRWIDARLAEMLGVETTDETLREIEKAKVRAGTQGFDAPGAPEVGKEYAIDRMMLASVAGELWSELRPLFEKLCERLFENQTSSVGARRQTEGRLQERDVQAPQDAHRLIDTILLAGGTSLLPGFEEAMMVTLFPDGHRPEVLRVGASFAIAAAAGGLSHILHNYDPPRLRDPASKTSEAFSVPLQGTLPHSIVLGVKQGDEKEVYVTLLDPSDPFVDDGGRRAIEGLPPFAKGARPKMRLVLGLPAGQEARRGRSFRTLEVLSAPGEMELEWQPDRERATVHSSQFRNTSHLWMDVNLSHQRQEAPSEVFDEPVPPGALAVDAAEDVVLDLGMSKIVAVTAERGWVSTPALERVVLNDSAEPTTSESRERRIVAERSATEPASGTDSDRGADALEDIEGEPSPDQDFVAPGAAGSPDGVSPPAAEIDQGSIRSADTGLETEWGPAIGDAEFVDALVALKRALAEDEPHLRFDDVVVALLALSIRPVVLLAGPPGCGKSTLVRLIARILSKKHGESYHEVAVQAHWDNDSALFGADGLLAPILHNKDLAHLVLFDEFNLTRPEYYMSRLFHALDSGTGAISHRDRIAPCRIFGTLNIDESSRPPSPKVIDRCFLLELSQVPWDTQSPSRLSALASMPTLPGLPALGSHGGESDERIAKVMRALHKAVDQHQLRHDLLPSRRVLSDIKAALGLHHRLGLEERGLMDRGDLVDRLVASRILVKISGAFDQLGPALLALEEAVGDGQDMPRTRRRLKLARQQARLGFVSPWQ